MRDEVAHMCIVYSALRLGFPRVLSSLVVWEYPDHMNVIDVLEYLFGRVDKFTAENQV
jgi:hypothetical protein